MSGSQSSDDARTDDSTPPTRRAEPKPWRTEGLPAEDADTDGQRKRPRWWRLLIFFGLGYLLLFGLLSVQDSWGAPTKLPYTDFTAQVEEHNVAEVFARGSTIEGKLREAKPVPGQDASAENPTTYQQFTTERPTFAQDDLLAQLKQGGTTVSATPLTQERGTFWNLLISFAPMLLLFGFWYWLFKRSQKAMGGGAGMFGGFGREKRGPVNPETVRVTFDDVAGIDEVEAEINEVVDFLREPDKYRRLGARAPKGVLLDRPARYRQDAAGSRDRRRGERAVLQRQRLGVHRDDRRRRRQPGPRAVRGGAQGRPSIIFIDEIDTIGRSRGGAIAVGGHDEREQTLNQILTEMDGFSGSEGVVVLAATNRPDVLDPALLRAGRFDRTSSSTRPTVRGAPTSWRSTLARCRSLTTWSSTGSPRRPPA